MIDLTKLSIEELFTEIYQIFMKLSFENDIYEKYIIQELIYLFYLFIQS